MGGCRRRPGGSRSGEGEGLRGRQSPSRLCKPQMDVVTAGRRGVGGGGGGDRGDKG